MGNDDLPWGAGFCEEDYPVVLSKIFQQQQDPEESVIQQQAESFRPRTEFITAAAHPTPA